MGNPDACLAISLEETAGQRQRGTGEDEKARPSFAIELRACGVSDDDIVGLITETDLFKIFLEVMGARESGIRVTALIPDEPGELALITKAISDSGGSFISFGQFSGESPADRVVTFKVTGLSHDNIMEAIGPMVKRIVDIR